MLVNFSFSNWMSFKELTSFPMIASKERQHSERVPKLPKYQTKVLPFSALIGSNSSGKTNLLRALKFIQNLVVYGLPQNAPIPVQPFALDDESANEPSTFSFEFLLNNNLYEFDLILSRNEILEERLVLINSTSEKDLYYRRENSIYLDRDINNRSMKLVYSATRKNQLFLTTSVMMQLDTFQPIYDWFRDTLVLLSPSDNLDQVSPFFDITDARFTRLNAMLAQLDTDVSHLEMEEISLEQLPAAPLLITKLQREISKGSSVLLHSPLTPDAYVVSMSNDGLLNAKRLLACHTMSNGNIIRRSLAQESEGVQWLIKLLPILLLLREDEHNYTVFIDEINYCLHPLITRTLIDIYLRSCGATTRSQLITTTHDVLLLDQQLIRRDELWMSNKDKTTQSSTLISLSDFKRLRYDKDLLKTYLNGEMGGIPHPVAL